MFSNVANASTRVALLPTSSVATSTLSRAEIEAARQTLERIYQSGSGGGALGGGASGGSRALGVLVQGLGLTLSTVGFWLSMQEPAGLPVLHETLLTQGPEGFFNELDSMLAEKGGDTAAAGALRDTVMGMLEQGQVHSAGVVLGETLAHLQEGGLISRHADPRGLAFDATLRYAQQNPDTVRPQSPATVAPERTPPPVAPTLVTPQAPALTSELQALRAEIAEGRYANSANAFQQGESRLNGLIERANELRAQGVETFGADGVQVTQVELLARRHDSVLSQYLRNAENGGALPGTADVRAYLDDIRAFDAGVADTYGRPVFGGAALDTAERRLTAATELRAEFRGFMDQVWSGAYANSADGYAAGVERLEAFRQQANALAGSEGVLAFTQSSYTDAAMQLEGRRLNSVLAQTFRDAAAGRPINADAAEAMLERAQTLDAEAVRTLGRPLFEPGGLAAYRDALPQLATSSRPEPAPQLEPLPEPLRLPGGDDIQRVAEEYGVSPHDIVQVMQANPGMSPEQAAQYIRGALLASPTGLDAPRLPPPPPNGGDITATTASPDPDDTGAQRTEAPELPPGFDRTLNVLQAGDLGFRTTTDAHGTDVVFQEFVGPRADYDRARWDALGYRLHDSWTPETGWITYVSDARSGEVIGYAANTRLANAADRLGEVVEHNATLITDPARRDAYIRKWRAAINVVLDPGATRAAPNEIQNNVRRLGEAIQAEWEREYREGAGNQIILPPEAMPDNRRPTGGFDFILPGPPPEIGPR